MQIDKISRGSSSSLNSELDSYLITSFKFGEDFQDIKISILQWWKEHSTQFSIMIIIAKPIVATSVSTIAVEQAFSVRESILDQTYSSMSSRISGGSSMSWWLDKSSVKAIRNRA